MSIIHNDYSDNPNEVIKCPECGKNSTAEEWDRSTHETLGEHFTLNNGGAAGVRFSCPHCSTVTPGHVLLRNVVTDVEKPDVIRVRKVICKHCEKASYPDSWNAFTKNHYSSFNANVVRDINSKSSGRMNNYHCPRCDAKQIAEGLKFADSK